MQLGFAGTVAFAWVFDWLMGSCCPVWGWHVRCTCSFFRACSNQSIAGWFRWPWTSSLASPGYVRLHQQSTGAFNVFCGSKMGMWSPCLGARPLPETFLVARQLPLQWRWSPPSVFVTTSHVVWCVLLRRGWACCHRRRARVQPLQPRLQTLQAHQQSNVH